MIKMTLHSEGNTKTLFRVNVDSENEVDEKMASAAEWARQNGFRVIVVIERPNGVVCSKRVGGR